MSLLPSTHKNNLTPRRGIAKFAPRNPDGTLQAAIAMSPAAEMTFGQEPELAQYISAESGLNEILDRTILALPRTISITVNNLSQEMKALYFVADNEDLAQGAATVTGEISPYIFPNRSVQLGGTANNNGGVFSVSALTAEVYAPVRANSTPYEVGDVISPATPNDHVYMVTIAGTSAASPPTFPTNGATVVDGGATLIDLGEYLDPFTVADDYEVDGNFAVFNVLDVGALAAIVNNVPAAIRKEGKSIRLSFDYTRAAMTVPQLATKEDANLEGEFWFYEQNPKGPNTVWHCANVTCSPTGDFATKSGTDYGAAEFEIAVLKPAAGPAMTQNGVPLGMQPT